MSGTGKKQRTKGNVKPSSSARAAELLAAEGYSIKNTIGFTGFGGIPLGSGGADAAAASESSGFGVDEPEDLDQDFRCSFRKAMKKDTVTKTKALREITSMISEKDPKAVSIAWQCWPRLYSKLALDGNFKVRELSHATMSAFAQKLERQMANQLKSVMPYWLMGEHDPYQVVVQAAKQAFQISFPAAEKRPAVLAFCKEAIISQCGALVFAVEEANGGENSSSNNAEESSENRASRLSSCALSALNTLVSTIDGEEVRKAEENFSQALFSSPKFWKLCEKSKTTAIRVAWFNLLSAFLRRNYVPLSSEKANKLVPAIVNVLDSSESSIINCGWNCLASYLDFNSDEFWQHCNFRKAFLPKLVVMTNKAYRGCADIIAANVTKVIRNFPLNNENAAEIHGKLLAAFQSGLAEIPNATASAFVRIYCDYCVVVIRDGYAMTPEFVANFLTDPQKFLHFFTTCLNYSRSTMFSDEIFDHLARLVSFVIDESPLIEPNLADSVAAFQSNLFQSIQIKLLSLFSLSSSSEEQEKADEESKKPSVEALSNFLVYMLKNGRSSSSSKLRDECASIARLCWKLYEDNGGTSAEYARIFRNIFCSISGADSEEMEEFAKKILSPREDEDYEKLSAIDKLSTGFLDRITAIDADKSSSSGEALGDVIDCEFALLPALDSTRKAAVFKKLCELRRFETQFEFLRRLLQFDSLDSDSVSEYIPETEFSRLFMDSFKSMCSSLSTTNDGDHKTSVDPSSKTRGYWRLFSDYLSRTSSKESRLPKSLVNMVLEHLTSLVDEDNTDTEEAGRKLSFILTLAGQLTSEILSSRGDLLDSQSGMTLVSRLFDIYCSHSDHLNEETFGAMKLAWTTALKTFISSPGNKWERIEETNLIVALSKRVLDLVRKADLNRERLEFLCSVAMEIIATGDSSIDQHGDEEDAKLYRTKAVQLLLPFTEISLENVERQVGNEWKLEASVTGRFPILDLSSFIQSSPAKFPDYVGFLNLAAYGLRFALDSSSSPSLEKLLIDDQYTDIAIWAFSALAYIRCILEAPTNVGDSSSDNNNNKTRASLKSFGAWIASLATEFWTIDQRKSAAEMALEKVITTGSSSSSQLATLALDFLRCDDRIPVENLRKYDDPVLVGAICQMDVGFLSPPPPPNLDSSSSIDDVIGFVYITAAGGDFQTKMRAFDWLMSVKTEFLDEKMLFSSDVTKSSDEILILNIALMRFLQRIVGGGSISDVGSDQRDFVLCATLTWLQSCAESDLSTDRIQLFAIFAIKLFTAIAESMISVASSPIDGDSDPTNPQSSADDEWNGFFLKACVLIVGSVFYQIAKQKSNTLSTLQQYLLRESANAIRYARKEDLMELELPILLAPELDSLTYPEKLQALLLNTFPLLESECVYTQIAAFSVLEKFAEDVYEYESKNITESTESSGEILKEAPSYFLTVVNHSYERIEHELDDPASLNHLENSPAFSTYLLSWKLLLRFFAAVKTDDRPAYTSALVSSSKLLDKLMLTLFAVLPEKLYSPRKMAAADSGSADRKILLLTPTFEKEELKSALEVRPDVNAVFLRETPVYSSGISKTAFVQQYACHVLLETLRTFPAAVRYWYNSQEKKMANLVEKFVVKYVSPLLCTSEIQTISKGEKKYESMSLVARPAAREVAASYKLEDFTMELVVTLPQNYPLNAAAVDVSNRVGVSVEQWRKWMLQLTVFLSHQNGNLLDGMLLWKRCIDKHLQGVEDCMICMMAVHGSNYQLPKITCKKCKKKFHAACLYKWFNTSSNTSCPLCRTSF